MHINKVHQVKCDCHCGCGMLCSLYTQLLCKQSHDDREMFTHSPLIDSGVKSVVIVPSR